MKHLSILFRFACECLLVAPTFTFAAGEGGWMKAIGVASETVTSFDKSTFKAGHFIATSVAQTAERKLLVAGHMRPYDGHPAETAILCVSEDGSRQWFREYAIEDVPPEHSDNFGNSDHVAWAAVIAAHEDGAWLLFQSHLLRIDSDGNVRWAKRFKEATAGAGMGIGMLALKSATLLPFNGLATCGVFHSRQAGAGSCVFAAVFDENGGCSWAKIYPGVDECKRPDIVQTANGFLAIGAERRAIVGIDPENGAVEWARQLVTEPFERGPKERPDTGRLMHYRCLSRVGSELYFGGVYDLSYAPRYRAPALFVARLDLSAGAVSWARRLHGSPFEHGGQGTINAITTDGANVYAVGTSTSFGASRRLQNNNAVVIKMAHGDGSVQWVRSPGRKKISEAVSEYCNEMGNAALTLADGSVIVAGGANSFVLPDPGFHKVPSWAKERYDALLLRITPAGSIQNLEPGPYPRLLTAPDPSDPEQVDAVPVPIGVQDLRHGGAAIHAFHLSWTDESITCQPMDGTTVTHFGTGCDGDYTQNPPVADFTLLPEQPEWDTKTRFNGEISTDPDGDKITRYEWCFDGGAVVLGPRPVRQLTKDHLSFGEHEVKLTVFDSRHASGTITKKIAVGAAVRGKGIPASFVDSSDHFYTITIATGEQHEAETNAFSYLNFYGPPDVHGARFSTGESYWGAGVFGGQRGRSGSYPNWRLRALDDIQMLVLRHDNFAFKGGARPGWFVKELTVRNDSTKRTYHFVPNQWLADDEPPNRRTWEKFFVSDLYPGGIIVPGPPYSSGMMELGGGLFVLPHSGDTFYFTPLDRSAELELTSGHGAVLGTKTPSGQGAILLPHVAETDRGVAYETRKISAPTMFKVRLKQPAGDWTIQTIWVFPYSWNSYPDAARAFVFLQGFRQFAAALDYGDKARAYLSQSITGNDLTNAFTPIIEYGAASTGILVGNPDPRLDQYFQNSMQNYNQYVALKYLGKLLGRADAGLGPVVNQFFSMMDTVIKAQNWGMQMGNVIDFSAAQIYKKDLLKYIVQNDTTLQQILDLLAALRARIPQLIAAGERNDAWSCDSLLREMRILTVGPNPFSENPQDRRIDYSDFNLPPRAEADQYPLDVMCMLMLNKVNTWRGGHHSYLDGYVLDVGLDKNLATDQAMDILEPVILNLTRLSAVLVQLSLLNDRINE